MSIPLASLNYYFLAPEEYTCKNLLKFRNGIAEAHLAAGRAKDRSKLYKISHIIAGRIESLPLIGHIIALFESIIVWGARRAASYFFPDSQTVKPQSTPDRGLSTEPLSPIKPPFLIEQLPEELLLKKISPYLNLKELAALHSINKRFKAIPLLTILRNHTCCPTITDKGLGHFSQLTSLQSLELITCDQITDAGLAHLSALTSLQSLDLGFCNQITDVGLAHLSELTSLQILNFEGCFEITDAGLAHLSALTSLQSLNLAYCNQITHAGKVSLRQALPDLVITEQYFPDVGILEEELPDVGIIEEELPELV